MRIANVTLLGDSNNCSRALIRPDETVYCSLTRVMAQSDYEQGFFTLSVTNISGRALGPTPLPQDAALVADAVQPNLVQLANLTVALSVNSSEVHKAGDAVKYTITAVRAFVAVVWLLAAVDSALAGLCCTAFAAGCSCLHQQQQRPTVYLAC